jgi:subtilase family serine protease
VTSNRIIRFVGNFSLLILMSWGNLARAQSISQVRIVGQIKNEERVTLPNTAPALVKRSVDTGRMNGGQNLGRMILQLSPTPDQGQAAAQLVSDLHDPSSPMFHKWLTPAQFGQSYGVAIEDATKVQTWLEQQGFMVHELAQSRRFIVFSGTVAQVESAFSTQMHSYEYNANKFISNATDIQIPAALQPVVNGIVRLHSDPRAPSAYLGTKVHFKKNGTNFTFDDGTHYLTPADFAKIYNVQPLYDAGIDGTGQSIAIVGRSNISIPDIEQFRSLLGLPANDPQVIVNGDDPGQTLGDFTESMLDVTWSGAVAPKAQVLFVVSQSNFSDGIDVSAAYIVDHNLAPVMSTSYGSCEALLGSGNTFYNALWQQAAAQGITSFVSAGDNGGAGCDAPGGGSYSSGTLAVNGISSTPYNVSVGGTQFDDAANPDLYWRSVTDTDPITGLSALGYIPEKVWNESSNDPTAVGLWAGSGGVSSKYSKPDWQAATGVPNDGKRDLPDLSLTAAGHDGYLVCLYGNCSQGDYFFAFGGTSASSPAMAGIMALVNQSLAGQPQGIANYVLYKLAAIPGVYHDIVNGNNMVPDPSGQYTVGYSAGPGYDLATGLGSFDANALVTKWPVASAAVGSATTLALGSGQNTTVVHGSPINVHATVKCSNGSSCGAPTGTVSLLATDPSGNAIGSGTGTLIAAASSSGANITTDTVPGGSMTVTARYSGDKNYFASTSQPVNVTVTPEPSQTFVGIMGGGYINNSPISIQFGQPVPIGVAVAGKSNQGYPTGTINLTNDGAAIQPSKYDNNLGVWTAYPIVLNYGEKSNLFAPGSTATSQSSSISTLAPGILAGQHQLSASYPGDNSFASSSASFNFTVTKSDSSIVDFFPIGTPVIGVPVHLAGQIALPNYACANYGGTITFTDLTTGTPQVLGSGTVSTLYCSSYDVPVTFSSGGMHLIRADYSGDANVNPSTQTYHNFPVNANAPTNISLSVDIPAANVGATVTFTANVTADVRQHPPTGPVTFLDGTATIGSTTLDATGNAVLAIKTLSGGLHNITANYLGDGVLTASTSNALTEQITDYVLQAFPTAITVHSASTATENVNLIPLGGFNQAVQLGCTNLAAGIGCSFAKSTVTLDGVNPTAVALTITSSNLVASVTRTNRWASAGATFALAGLLLPFGMRSKLKRLFTVMCLFGVGLYGIGCGSNSPSNSVKTTTYTIKVTATVGTGSGAAVKSVPLTVTVVN